MDDADDLPFSPVERMFVLLRQVWQLGRVGAIVQRAGDDLEVGVALRRRGCRGRGAPFSSPPDAHVIRHIVRQNAARGTAHRAGKQRRKHSQRVLVVC